MIDETDDECMMHVMNTNLGGPMRYIREALKIFMPKKEGALNTLTKNVAMRLVDTNIRCNAVAPGTTITPAHLVNKDWF